MCRRKIQHASQSNEKASYKGKKGNKRDLVLSSQPESPRKLAPRSIATSARNMGVHIPRTTQRVVVGTRKTEWKKPIPHRQERQKESNLARQSFEQLSKKLDKLEKGIKNQSSKGKKHCHSASDSNLE
jgi:hypothetical protein